MAAFGEKASQADLKALKQVVEGLLKCGRVGHRDRSRMIRDDSMYSSPSTCINLVGNSAIPDYNICAAKVYVRDFRALRSRTCPFVNNWASSGSAAWVSLNA